MTRNDSNLLVFLSTPSQERFLYILDKQWSVPSSLYNHCTRLNVSSDPIVTSPSSLFLVVLIEHLVQY